MRNKDKFPGLQLFTVLMDEKLHRRLKMASVYHNIPMRTIVDTTIRRWLDEMAAAEKEKEMMR
jgi:hypothetical protein